jgi:hypothetical protein
MRKIEDLRGPAREIAMELAEVIGVRREDAPRYMLFHLAMIWSRRSRLALAARTPADKPWLGTPANELSQEVLVTLLGDAGKGRFRHETTVAKLLGKHLPKPPKSTAKAKAVPVDRRTQLIRQRRMNWL